MSQGTLLLVDDDRLVLDAMTSWLREQGYEVLAASGREAAFRELAGAVGRSGAGRHSAGRRRRL